MRKVAIWVVYMLLPCFQSLGQNCFISANVQNICASGCNFSAGLFVQGINLPYTVTVTGPNYTFGPAIITSSLFLNNLCPGTYQIIAVDNLGVQCSQTTMIIPNTIPVILSTQVTNATCSTCNDGSVLMTASGGTPPYVYNFSNGITSPFATNLSPGVYIASVTDANGCTDYDTVTVGIGSNGNYSISGTIYLDVNANGVYDSSEPGMGNQTASINPPGTNLISSGLGSYGTVVPPGTYDVTYVPSTGWSLSSTASNYNVTITNSSMSGLDFGIVPDSTTPSGILSMSSGLPRCFWTVPYYLYFHNNGYTPLTGSMSFNHDPLMAFNSSTTPYTSQVGNVVSYSFTNLFPGQTFSTIVYMTEPAAGNTLNNYLTVNAGDAFGGQLAYSDSLIQVTSCSYDPNDKAVYPVGIGPMNYVSMNQRLDYLIRFQNTGNDTAFKVVVVDTLDGSFDFSTFTILGSSHQVQTELSPAGQITFTFDNILLPDSNVNEPGSHGYVLYNIKGRSSNADPTSVNNTAYIFFDQNAPVQTNTTLTTFSDNYLGVGDLVSNSVISIAPNPFNGEARINCESCQGEYILQLTDLVGKVVQTQRVTGNNWTISKGSLTQGTYLLEARSAKTGQSNRLKVTVY